MNGFNYLRNGDYLEKVEQKTGTLALLAKQGNLEVMEQLINKGNDFCIVPGSDSQLIEFFYILFGKVMNTTKDLTLAQGDLFYVKDFNEPQYFEAIEDSKLLYIVNGSIFPMLSDSIKNLTSKIRIVEEKDIYTEKHSSRVMSLTYSLAKKLSKEQGMYPNIMALSYASRFHDIGKVDIPDSVLLKPGKLTAEEYECIKDHPTLGKKYTDEIKFIDIGEIVEQHHERYDGSGYPKGLKGDEICLEAQLISIVDTYDAMTSERVYRKAFTSQDAIAEILKYRGIHFSELITDSFVEMIEEEVKEK